MSSRWGHYLGLCLIAGLVLGTNLGGPKLWDRDEPRNAGCAAEMLARGDWIVPSFDLELRTHKPVLLYWLIMVSYSMLGVNELAARLPSALLAVGTVICLYEMGRRLFSARVGLWSSIVLSTTLLFGVAGRAATPDSALIFCSTLALTIFVLATFRPRNTTSVIASPPETHHPHRYIPVGWWSAAAIYGAMGLAMLAKGPVGLVLPTAVIGLYLLLERPWTDSGVAFAAPQSRWHRVLQHVGHLVEPRRFLTTCWTMRPLTALAISLAIAAPWFLAVGWRTDGEFLRGFFLDHNFGRAIQSMEGHRGNVFFYPAAILVGFFPWSVFAAPLVIDTVCRLRRHDPWRTGYLLAIAWIAVYVGAFSMAKTKLPNYITPCFPALALLAGAFLDRLLAGDSHAARGWQHAAYVVLSLVGLATAIGIVVAVPRVLPGEEALAMIGLIPLLGGLLCLVMVQWGHERRAIPMFACTAAAFVTALFAWGAVRVARHQQYDLLLASIPADGSMQRLVAYGCLEPSWIFYGGRPIEELAQESDSPGDVAWVEMSGRWVRQPRARLSEILQRPGNPYIITTGEIASRLRDRLPPHYEVLASVPYFLKKDRVVLLGPGNDVASRLPRPQPQR